MRGRATRRRHGPRAAVMVEYAFLLVAVAIPTMMGLVAGGKKMLETYEIARDHILSPFP